MNDDSTRPVVSFRAFAKRAPASRPRLFGASQRSDGRRHRWRFLAAHRGHRSVAAANPNIETAIIADLAWLGLTFPQAPRRQSAHVDDYARALAMLEARGLVYPCFCTRGEIANASGGAARSRRSAALSRDLSPAERQRARGASGKDENAAMRLDMARALALAPADL